MKRLASLALALATLCPFFACDDIEQQPRAAGAGGSSTGAVAPVGGAGAAGAAGGAGCADGESLVGDRCVDPVRRHEPAEQLDHDNVVDFGATLTQIHPPAPPRSGFRIVVPPRVVQPGEEITTCVAWPMPEVKNKLVYAARMYATPGLHHSNVISKPVKKELGPNPYPGCHDGADDPFAEVPAVLPDVLFGSTTQVVGAEALVFPEGMAFRIDPTREIATNIHFLNVTDRPITVEVAYDFFTMPESELVNELAPIALQVNDFLIPPHTKKTIGAECRVFGGNIVSLMPHTHALREQFVVETVDKAGATATVYEAGRFDAKSEIRVYDRPINLDDKKAIRFACHYDNVTDRDVKYGLGKNEMCILFGYIYPVKKQIVAFSEYEDKPCTSINLGVFRDDPNAE